MSINNQLSDLASPPEFDTHAKIVEADPKPVSVLAINSGSSSLRFTLFKTGESLAPILTGKFERNDWPRYPRASRQGCQHGRVRYRTLAFVRATVGFHPIAKPLLPVQNDHPHPRESRCFRFLQLESAKTPTGKKTISNAP